MANYHVFSTLGLLLDVLGFALISYSILKPRKPKDSETTTILDSFGEVVATNLVSLDYFATDKRAKRGFWLVILGFILQLLGVWIPF